MTAQMLIIPSENRNREFDAKLLLGCVAVEAGFRAIVGSRHDIHAWIAQLPPAIYLAKDLRASSLVMTRILRQLGHTIAAWDEEGLVYYSPAQYLAARVDPEVMNATDMLFAWGADNAQIWRGASPHRAASVHEVGNPRLDLLRTDLRPFHESQRRILHVDYGGYILINSNFGTVNHLLPDAAATAITRFRDSKAAEDHLRMLSYRRQLFEEFVAAAAGLARAFPSTAVIVRPHPSENPEPWRRAARDLPNLHVRHDGNVIPWILGASAIIHNGCTTAVEAAVMGRSAIAYQPIHDDRYEIRLPNSLSRKASSLDALIALVDERHEQDETTAQAPDVHAILGQHLSGLDGSLCCDRIIAHLGMLAPRRSAQRLGSILGKCRGRLQATLRRRRKSAFLHESDHKNGADYNSHRFPALAVSDVRLGIDRLALCLGRFDRVAVSELRPNIFELYPAS